jgi:nucleotide-binding universal stress UspA family protein
MAGPAGPPNESGVVSRGFRILVGVDGSPSGGRALDWAIGEAQRGHRSLHLVTAWMFPMAVGYAFTTTVHEVRQAALDVLDHAVAHVAEVAPDVAVSSEAVEQAPAPALVAAAQDADLLVVGSRGQGGFEGLLVGSVSQYCTRHASCSVVVVH